MRTFSLLILTGVSAFGSTIGTFTFTGTATGTIGGTPFTDASLVVTAMADVSTVSCAAGECDLYVGAGLASFTIAGFLSGTFNDPTYFFDNQTSLLEGSPAGLVGFGDGSDDIQMYGALIGNAVFATYNLQTAVGPVGPQGADPSTSDWVNLPTSLGNFTVNSFTDFTFQATTTSTAAVPEPGSLVLSAIGLAALLWRARRRARRIS